MQSLVVGDLCITCNARASVLNNGLLVVIVAINPTQNGGTTPYSIRRVDGQPIPTSQDPKTGNLSLFKEYETWAAGSKLRRVDPKGTEEVQHRDAAVTSVAR